MNKRTAAVIKWTARILSIFLLVLVILMTVLPDPYREPRPLRLDEIVGLVFFPWGVLMGTMLAWRWPRIGGFIVIGSLLAFYLSRLVLAARVPLTLWFLAFCSPGIMLFLLSFFDEPAQ